MNFRWLRLGALRERLRGSLWFLPTIAVVAALLSGSLLSRVQLEGNSVWTDLVFGGGADGARGLLEVVAGSTITITGVTFSLTVVALVTASSLYSPRVLRTFLRDRGNQIVLSVFLATFAYSVVVLRTIRAGGDTEEAFVPNVAVTGALVFALATVAALVYFIHHFTQSIRVESIMAEVEGETLAAIERNYPETADRADGEDEPPDPPAHAAPLYGHRSGYVQAIEAETLASLAREHDVIVWYRVTPGERVTEGAVLAWAWRPVGNLEPTVRDRLEASADEALQLGNERTLQEDVAFGIRQLVDIAIRALSPALNDPTTCIDALGRLSVLLCALALRATGPRLHVDEDGTTRVGVPRPTFGDYLGLACSQIASYGAGDLAAVRGVLRLLEDVGTVVAHVERRRAVAGQVELVLAHAEDRLALDIEKDSARQAATTARRALAGDPGPSTAFTI